MIRFKFYTLFLILSLCAQVSAQDDLEQKLSALADVQFTKVEATEHSSAHYKLKIKQPLDHNNPDGLYFHQKVFLRHQGFDRPTVMVTNGYDRPYSRDSELKLLLNANQLEVEHRFFGESSPEQMDYSYLNLEQATADLHHVRTIFSTIYPEKWLSTGISKGGVTTIFYRYFYPDDIDVSVPYVAPINKAFEDKRIYKFLKQVGSKSCRDKLKAVQLRLLKDREEILPLLQAHSEKSETSYNYLGLEKAFEYAVLEYPFSFWQYGYSCNSIPTPDASTEELFIHFLTICDPTFFGDQLIDYFGSHYYQAAEEMGYYGYQVKGFKKQLKALPTDSNPHATFLPQNTDASFNDELLKDVHKWLKTDANKFIYLYGTLDTWSACAVAPNKKVDSVWFFMKNKSHGNANYTNMTKEEKATFIATLEAWLELEL